MYLKHSAIPMSIEQETYKIYLNQFHADSVLLAELGLRGYKEGSMWKYTYNMKLLHPNGKKILYTSARATLFKYNFFDGI